MLAGTIKHRDRKAIERLLYYLYPVPNPYDTQEQFDLFHHLDLSDIPLHALRSEERRIQYRLDLDERPPSWLWGRLKAVRQEMAHHQSSTQEPFLPAEGTWRQAEVEQQQATRQHTRGVPLAVRRIGVEGSHD